LNTLTGIIHHLQLHQIHMFYEAVGLMIGMENNQEKREAYLVHPRPLRCNRTDNQVQCFGGDQSWEQPLPALMTRC
jgi:hypothetical protein